MIKKIGLSFNKANNNQDPALSEHAMPSQVTPSQVMPSQVMPSQVMPSQVMPSQVMPSQVMPSQVTPSQVMPSQVMPSQVTPSQVMPSQEQSFLEDNKPFHNKEHLNRILAVLYPTALYYPLEWALHLDEILTEDYQFVGAIPAELDYYLKQYSDLWEKAKKEVQNPFHPLLEQIYKDKQWQIFRAFKMFLYKGGTFKKGSQDEWVLEVPRKIDLSGFPKLTDEMKKYNVKLCAPPFAIVENLDFNDFELVVIEDIEQARLAIKEALTFTLSGNDTETTGLDPHSSEVRLISLALPNRKVFVFDMYKVKDFSIFGELYKNPYHTNIWQNAKFDLKMLRNYKLRQHERLYDTEVAARLLAMGTKSKGFSLANLMLEEFNIKLDKTLQKSDFSGDLSSDQIFYSAKDALVLLALYYRQREKLKQHGLVNVAKLEFDFIPFLGDMEYDGLYIDKEACLSIIEELNKKADEKAKEIYTMLPANSLFGAYYNLNSTKDLLQMFKDIGIELQDTSEETLKYLQMPLANKLLEYRELIKGTQFISYINKIHPKTGRLHSDFGQVYTGTGRLNCREPNIQNITKNFGFRSHVKPQREDYCMIVSDYSQIELRLAGLIAKDNVIIDAYKTGKDLHKLTASRASGKSYDEVTKQDRQAAKAVNFGLIYGMSAPTLVTYAFTSYGVTMSIEEATNFRNAFFSLYSGLAKWHITQKAFYEKHGYVETLSGRKRRNIESPTIMYNTPVQGTGADILKRACTLFRPYLLKWGDVYAVNSVHDEIVVEAPKSKAEEVKKVLQECMEKAGEEFAKGIIPIEADPAIVSNWAEKP